MSRPVPLRAVAALFIERQQLDRPRGRRLTATSLARLAEDTGGIQIDTINVLDRAHYLTAWSRFDAYDHAAFDRLVYRRRVLFEYWAHAACFVPASQFAVWRRAMMDYQVRHTGWPKFLRKHPKLLAEVEETIRAQGPLSNADFEHTRPPGASGWWNWKPAMHALHHLWMTGRLLVHSRTHFQKRYDLAERVMGEALALESPTSEEFLRWHIRRSLHAMGAATEVDLRLYLTFPRVRPASRRRTVLAAMVRAGEVIEIEVAGAADGNGRPGRWFLLAEDAPALAAAARRRRPARGTTFLSPFDSFLWHRDRTSRLFGFDYRIEVYTPGHKRVHGYYSLPIFHDGRLIGRLDAKNHRDERRLEVRHAHFERWFSDGAPAPAAFAGDPPLDRERALAGIADALRSLAGFLDAERISMGRVTPAALAAPLERHLPAGAAAVDSAPPTKSVIDKLGVKPGARVADLGIADAGFVKQLVQRAGEVSARVKKDSEIIFLPAAKTADLRRLKTIEKAMKRDGAVWVVWPKGRPALKEDDVRGVAIASGLVDVKVVAFSATHSALKLVIPLAKR